MCLSCFCNVSRFPLKRKLRRAFWPQGLPKIAQGVPEASQDHPFSTWVPQILVLFGVFKKHAKNERPFLCFVLRIPFFCYLPFSSCILKAPQDPKEDPRELLGAPKDSPKAPLGALQAPNASRYLVFRVCVFCSFVLFIYCTSNTGSRVVNGQNGGPSARRESTVGRHFSQMPVGFLILSCVSSTAFIFSRFALPTPFHTWHLATRGLQSCSQEGPRLPQYLPRSPKASPRVIERTLEHPRAPEELPRSSQEHLGKHFRRGLERS
jgi:hypothetical protein